MTSKSKAEVTSLVDKEIERLESAGIRESLSKTLIDPILEQRTYDASGGESQGEMWIFARLNESVGLAYSERGYGAEGLPWGLIFMGSSHYGSSGAWYSSLRGLIEDSGYF
jgi:hypothetical protein